MKDDARDRLIKFIQLALRCSFGF